MYTIEDKSYSNRNAIFFMKAVFRLAVLGLIIFCISKWVGQEEEETEIVYVPVENVVGEQNSAEKEPQPIEVAAISKEYSIQGNYYSVFTQQQNVRDNFGNVYASANVAKVGINNVAKKLTYNLEGTTYTTLKGTIALSEKNKDNINVFCVAVYNEDGDMIYKSEEISDKSPDPIEINCNISGLSKVTIEMEGCTKTCSSIEIIMPGEGFVFE